jgi:DNA-binding XRE family transcriptional regulator
VTPYTSHHNRIVALNRGDEWKNKLKDGRLRTLLHPSKLRLARLKRGFSQAELAASVGLTTSTYAAIEKGSRRIKSELADLISGVLGAVRSPLFREQRKKTSERIFYTAR